MEQALKLIQERIKELEKDIETFSQAIKRFPTRHKYAVEICCLRSRLEVLHRAEKIYSDPEMTSSLANRLLKDVYGPYLK